MDPSPGLLKSPASHVLLYFWDKLVSSSSIPLKLSTSVPDSRKTWCFRMSTFLAHRTSDSNKSVILEVVSKELSTLVWFTPWFLFLAYPSTGNPPAVILGSKIFGKGGLTMQACSTLQHDEDVLGFRFFKNAWRCSFVEEQARNGLLFWGIWVWMLFKGLDVRDDGIPRITADCEMTKQSFDTPGVNDCNSSLLRLSSSDWKSSGKELVSSRGKGKVDDKLASVLSPNATLSTKLFILEACGVASR